MKQQTMEQYITAYIRDDYTCQKCGKPATQIAHRINQSKVNIKKYGEKIINNHNNLVSVCSLYCNGSYNIGFRSNIVNHFVEYIIENEFNIDDCENIDKFLENI